MSFIGDILGGYGAAQIGKYNQDIFNKQAAINTRNAEIKKKTFEQVTLPRIKKDQERNRSNQFVNLLSSGVDVDRIGETPYLVMLEQSVEDAFTVSVESYNSQVSYENELNNSLILQAQGNLKRFEGDVMRNVAYAKAAGKAYGNSQTGSILTGK
tara:strand:+ start:119 stop:583 length:465 start_codon:yes stop_codon:yes gene_type:complete